MKIFGFFMGGGFRLSGGQDREGQRITGGVMSDRRRLPILLGMAALVFAEGAHGQASGTVSVSGSVAPIIKVTSGGNASLTGNVGGGVLVQSPTDGSLATIVDLGDVGPGNTNPMVCLTQSLFLRTNTPASVKAAVTAESFGAGVGDVNKSDIGIGLQNLAASGPHADISAVTIGAGFDADPCVAPLTDGVPVFSRTLNDLAASTPGTTILGSTSALSLRGSFNSPNNRVIVDLRMAIAPQAFTTGAFSATITLTITAP